MSLFLRDPRTTRVNCLEENVAAHDTELDAERLRLDEIFAPGATAGERYAPESMAAIEL
jgi:hypothetical protein